MPTGKVQHRATAMRSRHPLPVSPVADRLHGLSVLSAEIHRPGVEDIATVVLLFAFAGERPLDGKQFEMFIVLAGALVARPARRNGNQVVSRLVSEHAPGRNVILRFPLEGSSQ